MISRRGDSTRSDWSPLVARQRWTVRGASRSRNPCHGYSSIQVSINQHSSLTFPMHDGRLYPSARDGARDYPRKTHTRLERQLHESHFQYIGLPSSRGL